MSHRHEQMAVGRLRMAFLLSLGILLAEVLGGLASHSLALLADAGHLLTDIFSLGLAWFAAVQALRPADARRTYGYHRMGILVALVNAVALVVIAIFIAFEAYRRFGTEQPVNGVLMLVIAAFALLVNIVVVFSLWETGDNLNVKSALLHVLGDAAASAGVLVAGAVIALAAVYQLDPIVSLIIAVLICIGAWRIIGQAVGILMEGAPPGLNVAEMVRQILRVPGVKDVHDLHVWSISNQMTALSCHILMEDARTSEVTATLANMKQLLRQRFGVAHATIEVECEGCETDNAFCSQLLEEPTAHVHAAER
ncbi:MAG TPA: cation diffusion facilitator family transporter [Chloroflexota bacterium]|jgi:cobalt-zinc-cadmium efflux system protein|nr:cation diffusion facilitator family transporter [Chloroflexota bacterium]